MVWQFITYIFGKIVWRKSSIDTLDNFLCEFGTFQLSEMTPSWSIEQSIIFIFSTAHKRIKLTPSPWNCLQLKHMCTWKIVKVLTSYIKNVRISKQKLFCRGEEIRRRSPPIPLGLNLNCAAACCTWCLPCQCSEAKEEGKKGRLFNASIYQSERLSKTACCFCLLYCAQAISLCPIRFGFKSCRS